MERQGRDHSPGVDGVKKPGRSVAVAGFSAIAGVVLKADVDASLRWDTLAGFFFLLRVFWIAIWIPDFAVAFLSAVMVTPSQAVDLGAMRLSGNTDA